MDNLIEATGLWVNKAKDGSTYYSGYLGGMKLLVFPNRNKEPGSNQPDFRLCVGKNKKRQEDPIKLVGSVKDDNEDEILNEALTS